MSGPPPGFPFYPLANPKGVEYKCEICEKPAYIQCSVCRVTYYCGTEHQRIDWVGIHEKICSTLMVIRKPVPFIASEAERKKAHDEMQEKNISMVNLTQMMGEKLLFEGKLEEAVPAALQCLKFTSDAYGMASVELVLPYLILAESSIGLGRLCQAEAYLAQAQWTVLKTKHECSNAIRSQLHRKLGLLHAAKADYDAALENLAKDIFYASCEFGTDHIRTAGGYFQMADVFFTLYQREEARRATQAEKDARNGSKLTGPSAVPYIGNPVDPSDTDSLASVYDSQGPMPPCQSVCTGPEQPLKPSKDKLAVADTLYARVVDIWADHLAEIVRSMIYRPEVPQGIGAVVAEITQQNGERLNDAQKAEAQKMLYAIEAYRRHRLIAHNASKLMHTLGKPDPKIRLLLALCMLNFVLQNKSVASQYFSDLKVATEFAVPHEKIRAETELMQNALAERVGPCVRSA